MRRTGWFILLAAAVVAVIVGLVILHFRPAPRTSSAEASTPTSEQKAYLPQIAVSDAKMSAAKNYLGHR